MINWHCQDLENRMYCTIDGIKIAMPRYYKDKIYTEKQRKVIAEFQLIKLYEKEQEELKRYNGDWYAMQNNIQQQVLAGYRRMEKKQKINSIF